MSPLSIREAPNLEVRGSYHQL